MINKNHFKVIDIINKKYSNSTMFRYFYYLFNLSNINRKNENDEFVVWMSDSQMANICSTTRQTIIKLKKQLIDDGIIVNIVKNKRNSTGKNLKTKLKINVDFILSCKEILQVDVKESDNSCKETLQVDVKKFDTYKDNIKKNLKENLKENNKSKVVYSNTTGSNEKNENDMTKNDIKVWTMFQYMRDKINSNEYDDLDKSVVDFIKSNDFSEDDIKSFRKEYSQLRQDRHKYITSTNRTEIKINVFEICWSILDRLYKSDNPTDYRNIKEEYTKQDKSTLSEIQLQKLEDRFNKILQYKIQFEPKEKWMPDKEQLQMMRNKIDKLISMDKIDHHNSKIILNNLKTLNDEEYTKQVITTMISKLTTKIFLDTQLREFGYEEYIEQDNDKGDDNLFQQIMISIQEMKKNRNESNLYKFYESQYDEFDKSKLNKVQLEQVYDAFNKVQTDRYQSTII